MHDVVLNIPSYYGTGRRMALEDAAGIAELNVLRIVANPGGVTVQLALQPHEPGGHKYLLYELGAGSLNVVLFVLEEGIIDIKAIAADTHLGGEDFVHRLVNHFYHQIKRKWKVDIRGNSRALRRLRTARETAMCELSSAQIVSVQVNSLYEGRDFGSSITRVRFEELCQDLFRCTLQPIDRVLIDSKTDKSQVQYVIPLGGCSRIPGVQKVLSDYFDGKVLTRSIEAEESNVSGLAAVAAILSAETPSTGIINNILFLEVLPVAIGVKRGDFMCPILPRNTTLPTKRSERIEFPRHTPSLHFYEGSRRLAKDNVFLCSIDITALIFASQAPSLELDVTIDIDANSCIRVTVVELYHGKTVSACINASLEGSMTREDVESSKVEERKYKRADQEEEARLRERALLDAKISQVSQLLSTKHIDSFNMQQMVNSIEKVRDWVDEEDLASAEEYRSRMEELNRIEVNFADEQARILQLQALLEQFTRVEGRLLASTRTPRSEALLREAAEITKWLSQANLGGFEDREELDRRRQRVEVVMGQAEAPWAEYEEEPFGVPTKRNARRSKPEKPPGTPNPTPTPSTTATAAPLDGSMREDKALDRLFSRSGESTKVYSDDEFEQMSTFLRNTGQPEWSEHPRLYTVLRLIGHMDALNSFLEQGIRDLGFPFTPKTLPATLEPEVQHAFLDMQHVVFSKAFQLEKNSARKHAYFSQEPTIFKVIGRLGRGAHGTVDKVMSTITLKEYARKQFRKTKGLRKADIQTFITELGIFKQVRHKHCAELVSHVELSLANSRGTNFVEGRKLFGSKILCPHHAARGRLQPRRLLRQSCE